MENPDKLEVYGTSEKLLKGMLSLFSGVVYLYNLQTKSYVYVSEGVLDTMGYNAADVVNMGADFIKLLLPPEDIGAKIAGMEQLKLLNDGEVNEVKERYLCADRKYKWFNCRRIVYSRDEYGLPLLILGLSHDITEHRERQNEIEKLALIAQKTTNAIIITDKNERIEWINEGYEKLTGYTLAEVVGKKPTFLLRENRENDAAILRIQKNFDDGTPFAEELVGYTKAGREYWMRVFADPILAEDGSVMRYIAIAQNITELKQNESRLMLSFERLKKFAFYTSHRLRAPVADILSILDVFDYQNPGQKDNVKLLTDLKTVSIRLDEVIHELNSIVAVDIADENEMPREAKEVNSVFMVDDDPVFINITGLIWKRFKNGISLSSHTHPVEALETLKNANPQPDIVLLDLNMPLLNGWQFLEELEKQSIHIDVYILTSSIDPTDLLKSKNYPNVKGYLTKPLTNSVLSSYFK